MADTDPKSVKAWANEYKNAKSDIQEIRDLIHELNNGTEGLSKSQIKANQNMGTFLDATLKAGKAGKANLKIIKDRAKFVKDLSKGEMSLSQIKDKQQDIEKEILKIQRRYKGVNKEKGKRLIKELQANKNLLKGEEARLNVQELSKKALGAADEMTGGMASKAKEGVAMFQRMGFVLGGAMVILTLMVSSLKLMNEQTEAIADQFGAMGISRFRDDLATTSQEFTKLGFNAADANKTTSDLANNFGLGVGEASKLATSVADTAKALGMSLDESSKLLGTLTTIGGLSTEAAEDLAKQAQSLAVANDVAPDKVLQDVAGNTELFAKFAKDGGKNVLRAAVQARKLGLEIGDVASSMEGMLDFQGSLNAEVEASVMLGRNLNLQKARELALAGDIEGFQSEILKQVGSQAEFDKMNVLQKQALAKATGLTVEQLGKMVSKEKEATTLAGELNKQKVDDLVSDKTITSTAKLIQDLKVMGMQLAETLGPAVDMIVKGLGMFTSALDSIGGLMTPIIGYFTVLTAKMIKAAVAQGMLTKEYYKNLGVKVKTLAIGAKENIQLAYNTVLKGQATVASYAKNTADAGSLTVLGSLLGATAAYGVSLVSSTGSLLANTAATISNTVVKGASAIASYAVAGASLISAAAQYFAAAASASAASLGFGTPVFVAMAVAAVAAMFGAFAYAKSQSAGDMMSPAGGKTMVSTKEGGLFEMSKNDDILAAPGLAAAVAGGGGGTTNVTNVDNSGLEKQGLETNKKLDNLITVMLDSPKKIGKRVGSRFNEAREG